MSCCGLDCNDAQTKILAVILDLDGTLLNTEVLTKDIVKEFLAKYGRVVDREKEDGRLGMMYNEALACIIKDYDLPLTPAEYSKQITPLYHQMWPKAKALPGANRLIAHLHKNGIPFALASNSITKNIEEKISRQQGWKESFSAIVGSDQVDHGKPAPDIFLEAAKRMGVDAVRCLVIEDSLVGVMAAKAAGMKVVAVPSLQSHVDRYFIADSVLHSLLEFPPEHWGLPAFEDWMGNALIIEPLYLKGQIREGLLYADADDSNVLPDQISGVFFGWAKLNRHGISKVVVSIRWRHDSYAIKRIIKPCLIGKLNKVVDVQQLQLLLVGYIKELSCKASASKDLCISEEDKSVASEALDLPIFSQHMSNNLLKDALVLEDGTAPHELSNSHHLNNVLA